MKINPKLYQVADDVQPFEIQECSKRKIELFYMSDFNGVEDEFIRGKGQFATWASADGVNYRVFIEKGYYEECKSFYLKEVNEIWTDFWDDAARIYSGFSKKFLYPLMAIMFIVTILVMAIPQLQGVGTYVMLGVLVAVMVSYFVGNRIMKKKTAEANQYARQKIVDFLGENAFNALVDRQKNYMDKYFDDLKKENENTDEANESEDDSSKKEEALALEQEEASENNEEASENNENDLEENIESEKE